MKVVPCFFRFASCLTLAAAAALAALGPARAETGALKYECSAPTDLARLDNPLKHVARLLNRGLPLKIVAIGSSSTAGAGASAPAMSYPSRLAVELKALFPRSEITVINRGINGEEVQDMVARFDHDVFAENPDLVIWQVGSNSVLRDRPLAGASSLLLAGLNRLRASDADVILMNPQYAPKVITKHDVEGMVQLIEATAHEAHVDLFQRYATMRYWRLTEDMPFSAFLSPDEVHMNDWGYGCVAKLLAGAIHDAATRPTLTATARPSPKRPD